MSDSKRGGDAGDPFAPEEGRRGRRRGPPRRVLRFFLQRVCLESSITRAIDGPRADFLFV